MYNANRPSKADLPSTGQLLKSTGIAAVVAGVPGTPQPRRMDVADLARLLVRLL